MAPAPAQPEKPTLAAPDAPRRAAVPAGGGAPASGHPAVAGGFFGRMARGAFAATFGAALLFGAAGCRPEPPVVATAAAATVKAFAPGPEGEAWILAGEPSHVVPAEMAQILDRVAVSRHSEGAWSPAELEGLAAALGRYAETPAFAELDPKIAGAFLSELRAILAETAPPKDAEDPLAAARASLTEHLLTLEKRGLEAQGRG